MRIKTALKALFYHSGAATLAGRLFARNTLTVVMFHRILPADDRRRASADPAYTINLTLFEAFLDFLKRQFRPVSLAQVETALAGGAPLPANALLITFDDGWEDTAHHAAPALKARGLASVVFVTSGVLTSDQTLWRDTAAILSRAGSLAPDIAASLEGLSPPRREEILGAALCRAEVVRPLMMRAADLTGLAGQGMAIGAHGITHIPLTEADDPGEELRGSKRVLEAETGGVVAGFAFPHGRYNAAVLDQAFASGYRLVFTSDGVLNRMAEGRPLSPLLGRVNIAQDHLTGPDGAFSPVRAAFHLMFREIAALRRDGGAPSAEVTY